MKKLLLTLALCMPLISYGGIFGKTKEAETPKRDTIEALTEIFVYEPVANKSIEKRLYYSIVIYDGTTVEKIFIMRTVNGEDYLQEIDTKKWYNIIKQDEVVIFK
jgi:hypothetical protein